MYETLYDITEKLGKSYFGESYNKYVGNILSSYSKQGNYAKKTIEDNEEIFNTYVQGLLLYDDKYKDVYGNILLAQKEYNEAIANGDSTLAEAAIKKMKDAEQSFLDAGWDNEAVDLYLSNFFDQFDEYSKRHQIRIKIKAEFDDDKSFVKNDIKKALSGYLDKDGNLDLHEILNAGIEYDKLDDKTFDKLTVQQKAYASLKAEAESYGITVEELIDILIELGYVSVKETENEFEDLHDSLESLISKFDEASKGIGYLQTAFKEMNDDGYVSVGTLKNIRKEFSDVSGIDEYIGVLANAKQGSEEFNGALSELLYKYLAAKVGTENLTEENRSYIESLLKEKGVVNATEVATAAIGKLIKAEEIFNNKDLDISQKIKALQTYAKAAGLTGAFLNIDPNQWETDPLTGEMSSRAAAAFFRIYGKSIEDLFLELIPEVELSTGDDGKKTGGDGSKSTKEDKVYTPKLTYSDLYDEMLENSKKRIEAFEEDLENLNAQFDDAIASGNDELIGTLSDGIVQKAVALQTELRKENEELEKILSNAYSDLWAVNPEWDGMTVDQIGEVGFEMFRNSVDKEIEALEAAKVDLENAKNKDGADTAALDGQIRDIEHQISLKEYNKDLVDSVGNTTIPNLENQIKENRQADYEAIKTARETIVKENDAYNDKIRDQIDMLESDNEQDVDTAIALLKEIRQNSARAKEKLLAMGVDEASESIRAIDKQNLDDFNEILDRINDKGKLRRDAIDRRIDNRETVGIKDYLEDFKDITEKMDDVDKTIEELLANGAKKDSDAVKELMDSKLDYYNDRNDLMGKALDDYKELLDRHNDLLQEEADSYDILIQKSEALTNAKNSVYDARRQIRDSQKEIRKELEANRALSEYMDEDTRKLLFNEDDYEPTPKK